MAEDGPKNHYKELASSVVGLALFGVLIAGLTSDYVGFDFFEVITGIVLFFVTAHTLFENSTNRAINRGVNDRLVATRNEINKALGNPPERESQATTFEKAFGLVKTLVGAGFAALLFIGLTTRYLELTEKEAMVWCYVVFGLTWAILSDRAIGYELNGLSAELQSAEKKLAKIRAEDK